MACPKRSPDQRLKVTDKDVHPEGEVKTNIGLKYAVRVTASPVLLLGRTPDARAAKNGDARPADRKPPGRKSEISRGLIIQRNSLGCGLLLPGMKGAVICCVRAAHRSVGRCSRNEGESHRDEPAFLRRTGEAQLAFVRRTKGLDEA